MRVVSRITPAPLVASLIASTCAVCGNTSRTLPTMPSARDHRHIRLQAVARSLVDIENVRAVAAAGAVSLRRQRGVDVLLLEAQQRLQPLALPRVFKQRGLLQPQPVDGLLADPGSAGARGSGRCSSDQRVADAELRGVDQLLRRRNHRIGPHPDQPHARSGRPASSVLRPLLVRRTCMASPAICATRMASSTTRFR